MANQNQIAVRDQDVVNSVAKWAPEYFAPFFKGTPPRFKAWQQDAALAVIENADLKTAMASEAGRISLVRALQRSASSGLSLNPQSGESALVPIGGKINFWPMKNGLCKKALETGALEHIEANTIYSSDFFEAVKTAKGDDYRFIPSLKDRGFSTAYFAVAVLKSGRTIVEYWTKDQIEDHKKKFGKGADRAGSAWNTNFDRMAEKTVLKALLVSLHLPQLSPLIELDDEAEQAERRDANEPTHKGTSADDLEAELQNRTEAQPETNGAPQKDSGEEDLF